jgi:hypothetical protein
MFFWGFLCPARISATVAGQSHVLRCTSGGWAGFSGTGKNLAMAKPSKSRSDNVRPGPAHPLRGAAAPVKPVGSCRALSFLPASAFLLLILNFCAHAPRNFYERRRRGRLFLPFYFPHFNLATLNLNMPGKPSFTPLNLPFQRNLKNSRMP